MQKQPIESNSVDILKESALYPMKMSGSLKIERTYDHNFWNEEAIYCILEKENIGNFANSVRNNIK
jgi:hypothetical protein